MHLRSGRSSVLVSEKLQEEAGTDRALHACRNFRHDQVTVVGDSSQIEHLAVALESGSMHLFSSIRASKRKRVPDRL